MIAEWIKANLKYIITIAVTSVLLFFIIGCPPQVVSLKEPDRKVTRAELQLELDTIITTAQIRMLDLDQQEQLRVLLMQNALMLASGNVFDPVGLISGVAAIYGLTTAGLGITQTIKNGIASKNNKVNV